VAYSDGTTIPATTVATSSARGDFKYNVQAITITFPRQTYGAGKTWKFTLSYTTTGLVESKGSAHTVYVPSIDAVGAGDTYGVTVDVPAGFGRPHFPGAQSASGGVNAGRQYYTFHQADVTQHALALAFGDSTIYNLNFNFPLSNDSVLPKTVTVALPPDLNNQKSYINKLTPAPSATHLDADGNVLADYHLQPHQKLTVKTEVSGEVKYLEYDLAASRKQADIPADLVKAYTKGSLYWQTKGAVAAEAKKLVNPDAPVINNVQSIYKYVIAKLTYNKDKVKFNVRQGAQKALDHPTNAVCLEYADLMIAMLRSQGIPARMPVGYGYSGDLKKSTDVADSLHAWVEAYVPGIGWMTFDPTWGEKFDEFGKSDLDHFAFAVWGEDDSRPAAEMAGGDDLGYQYQDAKLAYASSVQAVAATGKVAATRWVVLPWVAVDRVTVTAQQQTASDGNTVTIDGQATTLGSLAPGQQATVMRLVLGSGWLSSASVKFTRGAGGATLVLASMRMQPSAWGVVLTLGLLILIVVAWVGVRTIRRRRTSPTQID
jgi:transglutaminase-like putative cysteine protease